MHWVTRENLESRINADAAVSAVQAWSPRKKMQLKREHLLRAWERLQQQGWIPSAA